MRLAFMGTPEFAVPTLDALVAAGHDVVAVYTQPPRPANRGKKLTPSAVQQRAEGLGTPGFTQPLVHTGAVRVQDPLHQHEELSEVHVRSLRAGPFAARVDRVHGPECTGRL